MIQSVTASAQTAVRVRDADRALFAALAEPFALGPAGDNPFCNPSREVKPFSPATAMSGFGVEAAEVRTSAEVHFDPSGTSARHIAVTHNRFRLM
jgi:hypothetical protein